MPTSKKRGGAKTHAKKFNTEITRLKDSQMLSKKS